MQNLYIIAVKKHIFRKVNIIPVIGKADSCTPAEIEKFKTKVITFFEVVVFDVVAKYPFQLLKYQWLEGRFDTLGKLVSAHPGAGRGRASQVTRHELPRLLVLFGGNGGGEEEQALH